MKRKHRQKFDQSPKFNIAKLFSKRQRNRPDNSLKSKQKMCFFFVLIIFTIIFFIFLYKYLTQINTINCYIDDKSCASENIQINPTLYRQNIFFINKSNILDYYQNNYPEIGSLNIKKKFPFILNLNFTRRQVLAQIKDKDGNYFFIDPEGKIISKSYNSKLVTIISNSYFEIGTQTASSTVNSAINILNLIQASSLPINFIEIENEQSLKIELKSGLYIYINPGKDHSKQVDSLQFILQNSTIKNEQIQIIDLRFDSPIIKT